VIMEDDSIYVSPAKSEADLGKRLVYISENSSKKRDYALCWFGAIEDYASFHFNNGITLFLKYNFPYQEKTDDDALLKKYGIIIEMQDIKKHR